MGAGLEVECLVGGEEELDRGFRALVSRHPELESVTVENLYFLESNLSDRSLQSLLTSRNLKHLNLYNTCITGEGINPRLRYSSKLRTLNLRDILYYQNNLIKIRQRDRTELNFDMETPGS